MNGLLFIDDEEGVRRSVARALKKEPYPTYTVESGKKGIDFIKAHPNRITVVISDFKMPGLDGLETLTAIGKLNPEITRIILTGYATMEAAIRATNEGIDGFLTKPFDNQELRAKIRETRCKKYLKPFVPEQIYREIQNSPQALQPRFNEATILFSDIRGFTGMSQNLSPGDIATCLNDHYFAPMGEIAHQYNGTMDKHLGDGFMLVFGVPSTHADDAVRAVRAASAMQKAARKIDQNLPAELGFRLKTGIGINTGEVFSGILGSMRKKEFTSIGLPVIVAERLQGVAKGGEVLISEATYQKVRAEIAADPLEPVTVKGIKKPIRVYKVSE